MRVSMQLTPWHQPLGTLSRLKKSFSCFFVASIFFFYRTRNILEGRWVRGPRGQRVSSSNGVLWSPTFHQVFTWPWVKTNGIPFWVVGEFTTHFGTYLVVGLGCSPRVHGLLILTHGHVTVRRSFLTHFTLFSTSDHPSAGGASSLDP